MRATLCFLGVLAMTAPLLAEDAPRFQNPRPAARISDPSVPALGDIMLVAQLRHIKVWYAGRSRNWALMAHEVQRLQDDLIRAALLYENIPVEEVAKTSGPIATMLAASKRKDSAQFDAAYAELTSACNSCHKAGGVDYIRIQTPSSSPFSDQAYPSAP
ncbi:hypothetical protein ABEG18_01520 [Alsobacter sp. KACC 23698]|uniref:Cytochrome c domain-containing protein n=1 Tax=Alsobacter sp. KACC 23698 TaxID=3149229 RepID=A0AAU7JGF7_9HYPH